MDIIANLTIEGEAVCLDGKHFRDCSLLNCTLEYSGGSVVFERTHLRNCRHVFYGQARMTLQYLQGVGLVPHDPVEWGEFPQTLH